MNRCSNSPGVVLVTGATGYIASHCVAELLDAGYRVRGTVRSMDREPAYRESFSTEQNQNLQLVEADLLQDEGWTNAMDGCDSVLHVASPLPLGDPRDASLLVRTACEGTEHVLNAAAAANVRRAVVTSSIAAICYGHPPEKELPFTEDDWTNPQAPHVSAYCRSKTLAEQEAWRVAQNADLEVVTINPGIVLGPLRSNQIGTSCELIRRLLAGGLPFCPRIGWAVADVRDVSLLHLLALQHPDAAGERFICAGEFLWMLEIAELLRANFPDHSKRLPSSQLPDWLVRLIGWFDYRAAASVSELGNRRDVSSAKAQRFFAWTPRTAEEAIVATGKSLLERKLV